MLNVVRRSNKYSLGHQTSGKVSWKKYGSIQSSGSHQMLFWWDEVLNVPRDGKSILSFYTTFQLQNHSNGQFLIPYSLWLWINVPWDNFKCRCTFNSVSNCKAFQFFWPCQAAVLGPFKKFFRKAFCSACWWMRMRGGEESCSSALPLNSFSFGF